MTDTGSRDCPGKGQGQSCHPWEVGRTRLCVGRVEKTPTLGNQMTWTFKDSSALRQYCSAQQWAALL